MQSIDSLGRVRRCAVIFFELSESLDLDLAGLFSGGSCLQAHTALLALAAHLDEAVEVHTADAGALQELSQDWQDAGAAATQLGAERLQHLVQLGLVLAERASPPEWLERDQAIREGCWRPLSAIAHFHARWSSTRVADDPHRSRFRSLPELVAAYGPPPPEFPATPRARATVPLPMPAPSPLTQLARRRITCRNFAAGPAPIAAVAALLHRVFGAQDRLELAPGAVAVKKHSPSGGSLHPIEAYVVVRSVAGLAPGLYHYRAGDHALALLDAMDAAAAGEFAERCVAGQDFFAEAPVHVVLTARFQRNFWKYRNHAKAYRAIVLEAGHLSQMLYLAATELGWGAYITAAINEIDIERAFVLDSRRESPLAVCGFGPRAATRERMEFDPFAAATAG